MQVSHFTTATDNMVQPIHEVQWGDSLFSAESLIRG